MNPTFQILPRDEGTLFEDDDIRVFTFTAGHDRLNSRGTFFFAVARGFPEINGIKCAPGMYGCSPMLLACDDVRGSRTMIVEAKTYYGCFALGGPIEPVGRLRYINGCTDTGLIQPFKLGDPCLNALFFPSGTLQTPHTHPSHRVGLIYDGEGLCHTETGPTPMRQGDMFIIPKDCLHWFETDHQQSMRIIVFHPDSEFGPTDEKHQMLEATIVDGQPAHA